jgi:hypothetical protein
VGTFHESGADNSNDSRSTAKGTTNIRDMVRQAFQ